MNARAWRAACALVALLPALLLWPALRHAVEGRMALHMLVEFPLLLAAGAGATRLAARHAAARHAMRALAGLDHRGWSGATLASGVALFWMIPSALDAALLSGPVELLKLASWWLAGAVLAGSWRRMDPELMLFFVGNLAWMAAGAGMLYLDAPQRLCVNYLEGDQRQAGIGLVVLACALGALAIRRAIRYSDRRYCARSATSPALRPSDCRVL